MGCSYDIYNKSNNIRIFINREKNEISIKQEKFDNQIYNDLIQNQFCIVRSKEFINDLQLTSILVLNENGIDYLNNQIFVSHTGSYFGY